MVVVSISLAKKILKFIEKLVDNKKYDSRSDFIRVSIDDFIETDNKLNESINNYIEESDYNV